MNKDGNEHYRATLGSWLNFLGSKYDAPRSAYMFLDAERPIGSNPVERQAQINEAEIEARKILDDAKRQADAEEAKRLADEQAEAQAEDGQLPAEAAGS